MTNVVQGTNRTTKLRSDSFGAGYRPPPPVLVPAGEVHAVDPTNGNSTALCGVQVNFVFAELAFPPGMAEAVCWGCRQAAESEDDGPPT